MDIRNADVGARKRRDQLRLTFAYRSRSRTLVVPRAVAFLLLVAVPFVGIIYLAATCYFIFHDDLLASLTRHQVEMQYAYEDRVAALSRELENATQKARVDEADFADRVHALASRQDRVESRTALIAELAARMQHVRVLGDRNPPPTDALLSAPGHDADHTVPRADATDVPPPAAPDALASPTSPIPDDKPHPDGFDLRLSGAAQNETHDVPASGGSGPRASISPIDFESGRPLSTQIDDLVVRYDRVSSEDLVILANLERPADRISEKIRLALASAGLAAHHLVLPAAAFTHAGSGDTGGPFVPLAILTDGSSFARAAVQLESAIDTAAGLRRVLPHVPLQAPLPGDPAVTSPFGPRIDPFLGRPALHTGVDLQEAYGAPVHATAIGTVDFAGVAGGYGNMVEIDHGNGLTTRYAHLSRIEVTQGQHVSGGTIVGLIGATGRATGPHLHYEVRIDGEPVDPERFLKAGSMLIASANAQP